MIVRNGMANAKYGRDSDRTYTITAGKIRNLDGSLPEITSGEAPLAPCTLAVPDVHQEGIAALVDARPPIVSPINNPSPIDGLAPAATDHVEIYTDGASKGNPGHAALGVVLRFGDYRREVRQYLGSTTNNVAELMAIKVALDQVKDPQRLPVRVYSDSRYAIQVLTGAHKARRNRTLIREIQQRMQPFRDLTFHWVQGHAGDPLNERVDALANLAIQEVAGGQPLA